MDRFPETTFTYGNYERDEDGCLSEPVYQPEEESGPIMSLADCYLRNQCEGDEDDPEQAMRLGAEEGRIRVAVSSAVALRPWNKAVDFTDMYPDPNDRPTAREIEAREYAAKMAAKAIPALKPITREVAVANIPEWKVA